VVEKKDREEAAGRRTDSFYNFPREQEVQGKLVSARGKREEIGGKTGSMRDQGGPSEEEEGQQHRWLSICPSATPACSERQTTTV